MKRRVSRERGVLIKATLLVLAIVVTYSMGLAASDYLARLTEQRNLQFFTVRPQFAFLLWDRFVEALIGVWFFFTGAAIGSFLNVVVYRLPMGLSLVATGSRCPFCMTPIWARDNLPVLGWLGLGGRCRACRLPISSRYPIVEAITGTLFLLLYGSELVAGGRYLPNSWFPVQLDIGMVILDARWDLLGIYLYHIAILCLIWTAALMLFDRRRPPLRFWVASFAWGILPVLIWPWLCPVIIQWAGGFAVDQVTLHLVPWYPASGQGQVSSVTGRGDQVSAWIGLALGATLGATWVLGVRRILGSQNSVPDARDARPVNASLAGENDAARAGSPQTLEETPLAECPADDAGSGDAGSGDAGSVATALRLQDDERPREDSTINPAYASMGGMWAVIGLGFGWQFLVIALPISLVFASVLRVAGVQPRNGFLANWGFALVATSLLILLRWSWVMDVWEGGFAATGEFSSR